MTMQNRQLVIGSLAEKDGGGFVATVPELPGCMSITAIGQSLLPAGPVQRPRRPARVGRTVAVARLRVA